MGCGADMQYRIIILSCFSLMLGCNAVPPSSTTAGGTGTPGKQTTQTTGTQTISRTALPGQKNQMTFAYSVNPDCSVRELPVIRVLKPPAGGSVTTETVLDFPSFSSDNVRYECNRRQVSGAAIIYTPNAGYLGPDTMAIEAFYPKSAFSRVTEINITVK